MAYSGAPTLAAIALFVAIFMATTWRLLLATDGRFSYSLDDAYIHMAIAKNVALHGNWGVQADAFSAASSSPLWTALLALTFALGGVRDWVPLVLNLGAALGCILVLGALSRMRGIAGLEAFVTLAAFVLVVPLVPMVWIGMEHTLHVLLTLLIAAAAAETVRHGGRSRVAAMCVLGAAAAATRYESLFVVAGCAGALFLFRRIDAAVSVVAASLVPVIAVGLWNVSHGWFFLPASVMMKQTVLPQSGRGTIAGSLLNNVLGAHPPAAYVLLVVVALGLMAAALRRADPDDRRPEPLLAIFVSAALLHLLLGRFGWLFRYESYLIGLGVYAVGMTAFAADPPGRRSRTWHRGDPMMIAAPAAIALLLLYDRTIASPIIAAETAGHIYRQQRQMAAFIARLK
jgi:hypothetical protein